MNTISDAIGRGEIETTSITWEEFNNTYINPCADCEFAGVTTDFDAVCTLFEAPHNSIEAVPAVLRSNSSLMSVINKCTLKREMQKGTTV